MVLFDYNDFDNAFHPDFPKLLNLKSILLIVEFFKITFQN